MENFTTTTKRRASESKASEALALIRNTDQQGRVPPPLPYLPADYRPSPDSPRHFLVSSTHPASVLFDINSQTGSSNRRQRSHSIGYPLAIENTVNSSSSVINNTSSSNIEHYELVPYHEWTIIARNQEKGQLVLYNQDNQSITVQNYLPNHFGDINTDRPLHFKSNEKFCPYCHQPILSPSSPERRLKTDEPDYMDRNYFRLLASSQANTASNSPTRSRSNTLSSESNKSESFNNQNLNANAFNQGYYSKFFVEINKLGKGFRGSVFLCEHVLDGVKLGKYAVKKVAIGNNHPWLVKMLREVHLLERLRHPNVVSYKHSWLEYCRLTPFGPEVPCLFILMECANGGNLEEYFERTKTDKKSENPMEPQRRKKSSSELKRERIRKQYQEQASFEQEQEISAPISHITRRLLTMSEIWSLFLDIVQGLAHLHQHNIVHRDLKPPNLLLKYDDHKRYNSYQGIPRVLISDFGECEDLDENYVNDDNRTGATGTLEFMAPEHVCLDLKGRNTVEYAPEADMWSLGMVLYFLCYSRLPYNVIDDVDLLRSEILSFKEVQFPGSRYDIYKDNSSLYTEAVNDPNIVSDIPNELKLLIRMLLSTDPSKRPSCNEILSKLRAFRIDKSTPLYEDIQHKWNNITTTAPSTSYARPSASSFTYHPTTTTTTSRKPSLPSVLSTDTTSSSIIFDTEDSKETQDYYHSIKRPIKHRLSSSTHSTPPISEDKEMYREGMNTTLRKRQRLLGTEDKEGEETVMSDADDMRTKEGQKREEDMIHQDLLLVNNMLEASQRNRRLLDYQSTKVIKTITVLLKIISCTYSCSPYSTKPSLFYPVIFFAMLDFWSESNSPSLLLLVLHIVLIMGTTLISGGLCEAY